MTSCGAVRRSTVVSNAAHTESAQTECAISGRSASVRCYVNGYAVRENVENAVRCPSFHQSGCNEMHRVIQFEFGMLRATGPILL